MASDGESLRCVAFDGMKSNKTKFSNKSTVFNSFGVINNFMELLIINGERLFSVRHKICGVAVTVTVATNNVYFVFIMA